MILYTDGICGFLRWRGSVAPHALLWAIPASGLAVAYSYFFEKYDLTINEAPLAPQTTAWAFFTSILGFLVVFRAQLAYSRYWEGITLVEQACAVWLNGVSNLIAFCSENPDKQIDVATFQHLLTRLMSLLLCQSMADISKLDSTSFSCLDLEALDIDSLEYLETQEAKHAIVLQWVQRLVVENDRAGTIDVAPPILSRVFQEFSIGITHVVNANKLTTVPFPFQFAQMVWVMIAFFSILPMPCISSLYLPMQESALYTFVAVFTFWSVHYIAVEIEQPFGEDPNDLPLNMISARFNRSLLALLEQRAQVTPQLVRATREVSHHVNRLSQIGEDMMQSKRSQTRVFTEIRARLSKGSSRIDLSTTEGSASSQRGFLRKTLSKLSFMSRTSDNSEDSSQTTPTAAEAAAQRSPRLSPRRSWRSNVAPSAAAATPANVDDSDNLTEDHRSEASEPSIFDQFLLDPNSPAISGPGEPLPSLPEADGECFMTLSATSSVRLEEVEECPRVPQRTNFPKFWSSEELGGADVAAPSCPPDQRAAAPNADGAVLLKPTGLPSGARLAEKGMTRSCSPAKSGGGSPSNRAERSFDSENSREGRNGLVNGHQVNGSDNGSPFSFKDRSQFSSRESRAGRVNCSPALAEALSPKSSPVLSSLPMPDPENDMPLPAGMWHATHLMRQAV